MAIKSSEKLPDQNSQVMDYIIGGAFKNKIPTLVLV